jgi:hypothetical protein
MSAWFNLKLLGSAALALGISTVSLWPERASANIVFDFNGICDVRGCPATTSAATGVLTLTDAYVYGTDMTSADFVSFSYSSSDLTLNITSGDSLFLAGGLNSDGSLNARGGLAVQGATEVFNAVIGQFLAVILPLGGPLDSGTNFAFTNVNPFPAVPEPSTWAMMLIGFAGLGYASRRASRKSAAVAA